MKIYMLIVDGDKQCQPTGYCFSTEEKRQAFYNNLLKEYSREFDTLIEGEQDLCDHGVYTNWDESDLDHEEMPI